MMFFVNLISTILTFISLLFNGTLFECLAFMQRHQIFTMHVLATSICSSIGQLFIFSTIEQFGPVIFTIIMTMRQAFSILLSCIFYGHHLNTFSFFGITLAFLAIFVQAFIQFKRTKQSNTNIVWWTLLLFFASTLVNFKYSHLLKMIRSFFFCLLCLINNHL